MSNPVSVKIASAASAYTVLGPPTLSSAFPTAGYTGSSITVTGANFITTTQDTNANCGATFGGTSGQCLVGTTSTALIIGIGSGTSPGGASVALTLSTGGASVSVTSGSNFVTVLGAPLIFRFTDVAAIQSHVATITGANFIIPEQGGFCSVTVGGVPATSCSILSASQLFIRLGLTAPGTGVSVVAKFNEGGPGATATNSSFTVLAFPTLTTVNPTAGYVSSTITVTGTNMVNASMDASIFCTANVGQTAASQCRIIDGMGAAVVINVGTPPGAHTITVTIWPFNLTASVPSLVTVLGTPTLSTFMPSFVYFSSTISIVGSNFVTASQDSSISCTGYLNTSIVHCSIMNSTLIFIFVRGQVLFGTHTYMAVSINTGGASSPHNHAAIPATSLVVLRAPTLLNAVPSAGYVSSTITLIGTNFITQAQGGSCVASVADLQCQACSIISTTHLIMIISANILPNTAANVTVVFSNWFQVVIYSKRIRIFAPPIISSVQRSFLYASSALVVIGSNFVSNLQDPLAQCEAYLSGVRSGCFLGNETTVDVFVPQGSAAGLNTIALTFLTGGAVSPNNNATSAGIVTIIAAPSLASAAPSAGYISSTITLTGANFITTEQDPTATCASTVGGTAGSCALLNSSRVKISIGAGTVAGDQDVVVTLSTSSLASPIIVKSASKILTVLRSPTLISTFPLAGYVSSTITVIGRDFVTTSQDSSPATCSANVGGVAASCVLVNASSVKIVIGLGTSSIASTVNLAILTGNAISPYNVANSSANFMIVLNSPILSQFTPNGGYQSSSITVEGSNFITPAQGGQCSATVNGAETVSCSIVSSSKLVVVLGPTPNGTNVAIGVTFNAGGSGAHASRGGFVMLGSPVLVGSIPNVGYISSAITILGANFITAADFANISCTALITNATSASVAACSIIDRTRVKITVGSGTSAGPKQVSLTFLPLGISGNSPANFLTVLAAPTITSASIRAGYISSTVTVSGSNFITTSQDSAATCSASLGGAAVVCSLMDATTFRITLGVGVPSGSHVLIFSVNSASAVMPNNKAESYANFITVLDRPRLFYVVPSAVYASGTMVLFGTNFMTATYDPSAFCTCEIGGRSSVCTLLSATSVQVLSSSGTPPFLYNVTLTFISGGAQSPYNFVKSPENFVTVLPSPILTSAVFPDSLFGSYANMVTLLGSNFITPAQDSAASCTGYVGLFLAQSCRLIDAQTVLLAMADTDTSLIQSFSLTIQAGGITVYSSFPVRCICS